MHHAAGLPTPPDRCRYHGGMNLDQLPSRHSLSTKLIVASAIWMIVAMVAIGYTLLLSWKLQGGAAAINDAGSLRMRTYHIVMLLEQQRPPNAVAAEQQKFSTTLERLLAGDPARPLFLPDNHKVRLLAESIENRWHQRILPQLQADLHNQQVSATIKAEADSFVQDIDQLVLLIEQDNSRNTALLRLFQFILLGMAVAGSVSMLYLLYLLVIMPVNQLNQGMQELSLGQLDSRVEIDSKDEFGALANGFNDMAARLQSLVQDMEQKVRDKTRALEANNRQLAALYSVATYLHQSHDLDETCRGFVERVLQLTQADAGSVRLLDPERGKIDQMVQIGLPAELQESEACSSVDDCFCGQAIQQQERKVRLYSHDEMQQASLPPTTCHAAGFQSVCVFQLHAHQQPVGVFTLFFRDKPAPDADTRQLLDALGSQLGVAIENTRLQARNRQLAVMEERNLMAQGLHDSIAQSLSFLNLQVQMLESALAAGEPEQARENLAFIRAGVQESYEDVRELLLNFRERLGKHELPEAVRKVLERFETQARVATHLQINGNGLPLNPQQRLQAIFILQEALSNVRKHAQASRVDVAIHNGQDFMMSVADNGRGIDPELVASRQGRHVGLSIMQERARRIHARVSVERRPEGGTLVTLLLPKEQRSAT